MQSLLDTIGLGARQRLPVLDADMLGDSLSEQLFQSAGWEKVRWKTPSKGLDLLVDVRRSSLLRTNATIEPSPTGE